MKVLSAVVLGLVIALFGFWWGWVRAPNPDAVCDHIVAVTKGQAEDRSLQSSSEAALIEQMRTTCVKHKLDKLQLRGRLVWASYARCVVGASTLAEINRC